MVKIEGMVQGIYPKSEKLRVRIGRWERGIVTARELNSLVTDETREFEAMAGDGLMRTDPLFNWYDIFRPIVLMSRGMTLGPLTRFEETNTFYRIPELKEGVKLVMDPTEFSEIAENPPLPLYHSANKWASFLPGPETFYRYSRNDSSMDRLSFFKNLEVIYRGITEKFKPSFVFVMERIPVDAQALDSIAAITDPGKIILFTSGQLNGESFKGVKSKFRSIVVDPEPGNLKISASHSTVPGIKLIDGRNTRMETLRSIKERAETLSASVGTDSIMITNSDYMDFLPRKIADLKVALLREVVE